MDEQELNTKLVVWVHRAMVIPAPMQGAVRNLTENFTPASKGMFITPLASPGGTTAQFYISVGLIDETFATMMTSPQALVDGAATFDITVSLDDATSILANAIVTEESSQDILARLNLMVLNRDNETP